jgi:hypothetical protein
MSGAVPAGTRGVVTELRDITKLTWPFPRDVVKLAPKGGASYVPHPVVEQRLLRVLGPPSTRLVEIVRGDVAGKPKTTTGTERPPLHNVIVGVVLMMEATVDGVFTVATEAGDVGEPHNWPTDGARLKDAFSDAYKRCAMRLGVGLHLWCKDGFHLHEALERQDLEGTVVIGDETAGVDEEPVELSDVPDGPDPGSSSPRPSTGPRAADPGTPTSSSPGSAAPHGDRHPDTPCPECGKPFGNHSLTKRQGRYVHRKCP